MNKADKIHLNQRWISETEEKINALEAEISTLEKGIRVYNRTIMDLEGEEE